MVSPQSFGILMAPDTPSSGVTIHFSNVKERACVPKADQVSLLPARSQINRDTASEGEVFVFEVTHATILAFAEGYAHGDTRTLCAPVVIPDARVHLLSRVIRPFLLSRETIPSAFENLFVLSFLAHLVDSYGMAEEPTKHFVGGLSPLHRRLVEQSLADAVQQPVRLQHMATLCGFSARHFARAFKQSYGESFHRRLTSIRIDHAKGLLLNTGLSLKDIALQTGYADQATFTESFTKHIGSSPGRFRRRYVN